MYAIGEISQLYDIVSFNNHLILQGSELLPKDFDKNSLPPLVGREESFIVSGI